MKTYKAVLFAPDGDWVTDFKGNTKDEVMEKLADKGSKWYFYPFEGIILDKGGLTTAKQRLIDIAANLPQELAGKSVKTVSKWLESQSEELPYELATRG